MSLNRFVPPKPKGRGVPAGRTMNQIRRYVIRQARQTYNNVVTPMPDPIPKGSGLLGRVGGGIFTWAIDQLIFTPSAAVGTIPDWIGDIPEQKTIEEVPPPPYTGGQIAGKFYVTKYLPNHRNPSTGNIEPFGEQINNTLLLAPIKIRKFIDGVEQFDRVWEIEYPYDAPNNRGAGISLTDSRGISTNIMASINSYGGRILEFIAADGTSDPNDKPSGKTIYSARPSSFPPSLGRLPDSYTPPTLSKPRLFLPPPRQPKVIITPSSLSDQIEGNPLTIFIDNPPPDIADMFPPPISEYNESAAAEQTKTVKGKLTQTFLQSGNRPSAWLTNQSNIGANSTGTKITKKYTQTNKTRVARGGGGVKTDTEQELEKELAEQTQQELEIQTDKKVDLTPNATDAELFRQTVVEILRGYQPQLESLVEQSLQQITPSDIRNGICQETLPDGCITQALENVLNNQPSNDIKLDETILDLFDKLGDGNLEGNEVEDEIIEAENIRYVLVDIVKTPLKGRAILRRTAEQSAFFAGYFSWIVSVSSGRYHLPEIAIRKKKSAFKAPVGVVGYNMYADNGATLKAKVYIQPNED